MTAPSIAPPDRLVCTPEVLTRVLDGEAVILHLGSGTYFGMNPVATRAWEHIVAGTTFAALCEKLEQEFDVPEEELIADMRAFVAELIDQNLVSVTPAS